MKVLRLVTSLVRGLRASVGLRQFYELLVIAVREVKARERLTSTSEQKQAAAFEAISMAARRRDDLDPKAWAINLALEVAVMLVKGGVEWLLGQATPTVRHTPPPPPLRAALVFLVLAAAAPAFGQVCEEGMTHKSGCTDAQLLSDGATVSTQTCPCRPGLVPTRSSGCKCLPKPGGTTTPTTTSSSTTRPTTSSTVTSTTRPASSSTVTSTSRPPSTSLPSTTTIPAAGLVTGPIRPSPRDRSIKATPKRPDDLRWAQLGTTPRTASQPERDFYEHQRVLDASQFTMAVQAIPACRNAVGKCYTHLSGVVGKLGGEYEDRGLCRGNVWDVPADGRHYSFTRYCLEAIRACLLAAPSECATAFGGNRPLLDELDMDVVGGRCVAGTAWTFGPLPTFDPRTEDLAPVDTRAHLPRPTAAELTKLQATHVAHNRGCLQACGEAVDESMVSAQIAHVQYEAACFARAGTYAQKLSRLHFCQMKPFVGSMHPRWSPAERCDWCKVQHAFHMRWAAAQEAGDWGATRKADTDHFTSHLCANDGDDRMDAIFSCAEKPCNPLQCPVGEKRGRATCREYLPVLKARLGIP